MDNKDPGRPGGLSSQATEPVPVSALRASIPDAMLDDRGRCCGRKPISYKRTGHWFCDRCSRSYAMATSRQIPNWAWNATPGGYYPTYPEQEPYRTMLAQAIEARRAETAKTGSVEDESAVGSADAPNTDRGGNNG